MTSKSRFLVVYYTRSGATALVARRIAEVLQCDLEQLVDPTDRGGLVGWLRSAVDGVLQRTVKNAPRPKKDPADYDLVIIGTPVWASSMSAPVRTYLQQTRGKLKRVSFFLTHGGSGRDRVFAQMEEAAGKHPEAVLAVTEREIETGAYRSRARELTGHLRLAALERHAWRALQAS